MSDPASAIILAMTAVQAISQIGQGYEQRAEDEFNATVLDTKAAQIDVQKDIQLGQDKRAAGRLLSTSIANVGGSGIGLSGSAMAVMVGAQTQMNIDMAIGQFNLEQEKYYTQQEAEAYRRKGARSVRGGYSRAFSTLLSGGYQYASRTGGLDINPTRKTPSSSRVGITGSYPSRNPAGAF